MEQRKKEREEDVMWALIYLSNVTTMNHNVMAFYIWEMEGKLNIEEYVSYIFK